MRSGGSDVAADKGGEGDGGGGDGAVMARRTGIDIVHQNVHRNPTPRWEREAIWMEREEGQGRKGGCQGGLLGEG